jgi:hypothetical protein
MKKHIIGICSALLLVVANSVIVKAEVAPGESIPKLDSLLNLHFNAATYQGTVVEIAKYNKAEAQQIDSAIKFMYSIPPSWNMTAVYQNRMLYLRYRSLPGFALLVEQDLMLYNKINTQYPIQPIKVPGYGDVDYDKTRVISLKPVIYLYPEKEMKVELSLGFKGKDLYTWPHISEGMNWAVTAKPDGMLTDTKGEEYPYLFWEGEQEDMSYVDNSEGFVMPGIAVEKFLNEKLKVLGLNARERTDFITFWVPKMKDKENVFLRFETKAYDKAVPLNIIPKPESMQRVFMVWREVPAGHTVKPQALTPFTRKGFTVIEWGGSEMPKILN